MRFERKFLEEPKFILIPVIDVLLAVFLFLAVLAFKNSYLSLPLELPSGKGVEYTAKVLDIFVDAKGNVYIGTSKVSLNKLKAFLKKTKPEAVNLFADKRTPYGEVISVLNLVREAGITSVNLIVKKGNTGSQ